MTGKEQPIGIEDAFDGLSESDRRIALRSLRRRSTPVELDALAEATGLGPPAMLTTPTSRIDDSLSSPAS